MNKGERGEAIQGFKLLLSRPDAYLANSLAMERMKWNVEAASIQKEVFRGGQYWAQSDSVFIGDPEILLAYWENGKIDNEMENLTKLCKSVLNFRYINSPADFVMVTPEYFHHKPHIGLSDQSKEVVSRISVKTDNQASLMNGEFANGLVGASFPTFALAEASGNDIISLLGDIGTNNTGERGMRRISSLLGSEVYLLDSSEQILDPSAIVPLMMPQSQINTMDTSNVLVAQRPNYAYNSLNKLPEKRGENSLAILQAIQGLVKDTKGEILLSNMFSHRSQKPIIHRTQSEMQKLTAINEIVLGGRYSGNGYKGINAQEMLLLHSNGNEVLMRFTDDMDSDENISAYRLLESRLWVDSISKKHAYVSVNVIRITDGEFKVLVTIPFNLRIKKMREYL